MNTFQKLMKILKEQWEHPYSGKDYFDDTNSADREEANNKNPESNPYVEHLKSLKNHYDIKEHGHINRYTSGSFSLNSHLYTNTKMDDELKEHSDTISKELKSHKSPKDMHVYTGTGFDPSKLGVHEAGHIKVHLPAFTSTSVNPAIAKNFSNYTSDTDNSDEINQQYLSKNIIKIHIPKGSHGAYIAHHSNSSHEHEFLLDKGSKLHIHPEPTVISSSNGDSKLKIWHAKLVHDGTNETRHMNEE